MAPAEVKPVKIQSLANVVAISAGLAHGLALRNDGTVWAWGYNGNGQLGDGTTVTRRSPVQVIGLGTATAIAAGENHSLAILVDGSIWAWGSNGFGQLGNGESGGGADRDTPILVDLDRTPDDQGSDTLRAVKTSNGADVYLDFAGAVAGGWRMFADADRTQIGVTALTPDAVERSFLDSGAIAIPGIRYYALRGLSLCSLTPGP